MANWAKYREDIVALPVVKRARHSIHFQLPDGKIQAEFSGAPCHYQDTDGLWKPIDTKLLALGDGFYGCPHSKVKVHPDGRVALVGTDYVQRVELPSAQTGLVDGDKLVRKFSFGEQRSWVTEDGFRSEIQLNRIPTLAEAKKLIATESGTLSAEYLKSLTTATDAKGSEHTYSTLAALRTWLSKATYPVVIDPDFSAGAGDGHVSSRDTTYATAHSTSFSFSYNGVPTFIVGQNIDGFSRYLLYRGLTLFDTSAIGAGSTVTQVNLKLVATGDSSGVDFDIVIKKYDWSELAGAPTNTTYRETAYDGALAATSDDNIWRNTNGISTNTQYTSGNLSTTWVSKTGTTYYSLVSSRDISESVPASGEYLTLGSATNGTAGYRPVLTVEYTEDAGTNGDVTAVVAASPCAAIAPTVTGGTWGTVTAVLAASPCAALAPTVTATRSGSVTAVLATSPCAALAPTISGVRNGTVIAVLATSPAAALAPAVSGIRNGSITAVVAASPCAALAPTISGTRNQTVVAVVAASPASALAPAVTGTRNQTVTAVIATSPCAALAPSVSATRNQTVTAVIATSPASALAPSVLGTINISVTAVVASSPAQALAPSVTGTRNQTVVAVVATSVSALLAPAVTGTRSQTKSPTTVAQSDIYGPLAWVDLENIVSSNDLYATTYAPSITPSETILSTGYGFTIPPGSTIAGIAVSVERKAVGTYGADASAKLIKGGAISGDEKSTNAIIPASDELKTFGADGNLWGNTLDISDVNAANFGFAYSAFVYGSTISVDHIRITVFYLGDGIIGDVTAVTANAPAAALAPSVSGSTIINGSVTAVIATSQAAALAPTVSGICNGSIVAVIAAAPASAIAPTVTGIANGSVSAVTADTPAVMIVPAVSGTRNGSITAVIATAPAAMLAPVVTGIIVINGTVTATIAYAPAAALAPTVSAEINGHVTVDTSTCTADFLTPGVFAERNETVSAPSAGCGAEAIAPVFVGQLFGEVLRFNVRLNRGVSAVVMMNQAVEENAVMSRTVEEYAVMNLTLPKTAVLNRTVTDKYAELEKLL